MRRDVFQGIVDPNRRSILGLLARQKLTLNGVTGHFRISRPAISKHIKILVECGLVITRRQGHERYCEARFEKLNEVSDWVERCRKIWTERLDALEDYLAELQTKEKNRGRRRWTLQGGRRARGLPMSEDSAEMVRKTVESLYRSDSRRILATLIRLLGDFELAEEALHDAFTAAIEQWPRDGLPANPRAWLISAGRHCRVPQACGFHNSGSPDPLSLRGRGVSEQAMPHIRCEIGAAPQSPDEIVRVQPSRSFTIGAYGREHMTHGLYSMIWHLTCSNISEDATLVVQGCKEHLEFPACCSTQHV
jgi:DNA-binding transcriptional ArsR family regulator